MRATQFKFWMIAGLLIILLPIAIYEAIIGSASTTWYYLLGLTEILMFAVGVFLGSVIQDRPA